MKNEELIAYIKEFIEIEDGVAIKLYEFLSSILINSDIDDDFKNRINTRLSILVKEGEKHQRLVKEIEDYVVRSDKDEF